MTGPARPAHEAALEMFERDGSLLQAENFAGRARALDDLELEFLEQADQDLAGRANALIQRLNGVNERLFRDLLAGIRYGDLDPVRRLVRRVAREASPPSGDAWQGYDELDALLNDLLELDAAPADPEALLPGMVFYQPTPARIILKLADELGASPADVFYDLGSGLGHVPILYHLLTGAPARGVEIEAAYCRYAGERLRKLGPLDVRYIQADARAVDLSDGTIFYMYTPFTGDMLRQVLARIAAVSEARQLRVCTYGLCTLQVGREPWLRAEYRTGSDEGSLGIFASR